MPKAFKYSGQEKLPISAFIITLNEEKNIRRCLESLSFCEEIIVVDSGSVDLTCKIAEEMGAIVHFNEFKGYKEQKQFALDLCTKEWALSLDADERISEEFYQFIATKKYLTASIDGYEVKRLHWFLGQWINHSGLYPDYKLRFFRRAKGKLVGERVHEVIKVEGLTSKLSCDLLHYSWSSIKEYFVTQINYAHKVAENKAEEGKKTSLFGMFVRSKWAFLYRYFIRLGFLDGFAGFIVSLGAAIGTCYKYLYLWELNKIQGTKSVFPKNIFLKLLLKPAQLIYFLGASLKLKIVSKNNLPIPIISIGNLSVGGSGKTPFTIWLAQSLFALGMKNIAVLSRGYKSSTKKESVEVQENSSPKEVGDEPLLMKQSLGKLGVNVIVDPNRCRGGQFALEKLNAAVILLDDGFQHVQLERDRNICLLDCSDDHFDELLPIGSRREPLHELKRADVFILTRYEFNKKRKEYYCQLLSELCPNKPILFLKEEIKKFTRAFSQIEEYPKGKRVVAFCGLGNPRQFLEGLKSTGVIVQKFINFPDHHKYSPKDLKMLYEELENNEADYLVTSTKDEVKLPKDNVNLQGRLLVIHLRVMGFDGLASDMSIQLSNLLGTDIFNSLRAVWDRSAEKID